MNFETWILKMRRANKVPFGTAYELFAREAWTAALAIERETCAKTCDAVASRYKAQHDPVSENIADECAAEIRAGIEP